MTPSIQFETEEADHLSRVANFRQALTVEPDGEQIVRQHILHGSAVAISNAQEYALKKSVSSQFSVDPNQDVFVVGSAKLGFSIAPHKRFNAFNDRSDIDVAIVSHDLYFRVWHEVHQYSLQGADWPEQEKFKGYLAWGWIRPDLLPRSKQFQFSNSWFEFFRSLQQERVAGPFKVAAALYHDISFLIKYQHSAVEKCREE
ncbi:hypothetical protein ACI3KS_11020 [Microbacterium sp. ZW T5_45]|uniref:hypothetical protein n=1 Tax=Microbacterium sp. ZW T5_45 TaxID=3378080 RepID=UPI003851FD78